MGRKIEFNLQVDPVPKARPRMTRGGFCYTPKKTADAEAMIRTLTRNYLPIPRLSGPLKVSITFWVKRSKTKKNSTYPCHRPDLDNFCKLVLDAMNPLVDKKSGVVLYRGFWDDDSQIVDLYACKRFDPTGVPGIDVTIEELEGQQND